MNYNVGDVVYGRKIIDINYETKHIAAMDLSGNKVAYTFESWNNHVSNWAEHYKKDLERVENMEGNHEYQQAKYEKWRDRGMPFPLPSKTKKMYLLIGGISLVIVVVVIIALVVGLTER